MRTRINELNTRVACIAVVAYGALLCSTTNPANAATFYPGSLVSYWNFDEAASGTIAAQDVATIAWGAWTTTPVRSRAP